MTFNYQYRHPFLILQRIAKYNLDEIDHFLDLAGKARSSRQELLENLVASAKMSAVEDWLVDDFSQIDEFPNLAGEFAVIGLWRCVELHRKQSIAIVLGKDASRGVFKNKVFKKKMLQFGIHEEMLRCARSVDELRCLNNSIKHERRVGNELSNFRRWKRKLGNELGDLLPHYMRLRPLAERYLQDLTCRLCLCWKKKRSHPNN